MTVMEIKGAIGQHNKLISDCQHQLEGMRPAFMYDYDVIDKLENILQDAIACKDMLSDMLKDGV